MKKTRLIAVIIIVAASALLGCRGKEGADPYTPGAVFVKTSRAVALADGSDAVIISASVWRTGITIGPEGSFSGDPVADGVPVAFSVDSGILSASTATTINGIASVTLTHAPISGANNLTVLVRASAGGVLGEQFLKFINQPASADVFIATYRILTNVAELKFALKSTAGATFDNAGQRISALPGAGGMPVTGNFDPVSNSTTISLSSAAGFTIFGSPAVNTASSAGASPPAPPPHPFVKATFAVAADAGLPAFGIDATAPITATDTSGNAIDPPVTADNFRVTVTYDTEIGELNRPAQHRSATLPSVADRNKY